MNNSSDPGAGVKALIIGALSALLIGLPIAALGWFFIGLLGSGRPDLAFFSAYFFLVWGLYFSWPGDLIVGGLGGVIALALARRVQGFRFIVSVACCGALLGALNGAWIRISLLWHEDYLIALGAGAGLLTGPIAGLLIRRACLAPVGG